LAQLNEVVVLSY